MFCFSLFELFENNYFLLQVTSFKQASGETSASIPLQEISSNEIAPSNTTGHTIPPTEGRNTDGVLTNPDFESNTIADLQRPTPRPELGFPSSESAKSTREKHTPFNISGAVPANKSQQYSSAHLSYPSGEIELDLEVQHSLSSIDEDPEKETTEATFNRLDFVTEDDNWVHGINGRGKISYNDPKQSSALNTESRATATTKYETMRDRFLDYLPKGGIIGSTERNQSNDINFEGKLISKTSKGNVTLVTNDISPYVMHDLDNADTDHDEGFIKLRNIIHAAERSILDFQNDIQVSNIYAKLREVEHSDGQTSWLKPNGRFETGFWDDWPERIRKSKQTVFKGKPLKTVWTPSSKHNVVKNKKKIPSKTKNNFITNYDGVKNKVESVPKKFNSTSRNIYSGKNSGN